MNDHTPGSFLAVKMWIWGVAQATCHNTPTLDNKTALPSKLSPQLLGLHEQMYP
jgi:hypothetical protein